jgi:hypothetical protein
MPLVPPLLTAQEYDALDAATKNVQGWLNVKEQAILYALAKVTEGPILEMGCFKGKSTTSIFLARQSNRQRPLHAVVDLFKDHLDAGRGDFESIFRANVAPLAAPFDLRVLRISTFEAEAPLLEIIRPFGAFNGIFVDADHSYASVLKDGLLAHKLLAPCGWVAFHDAIRWEGSVCVLPACLDIPEIQDYGFVGIHSSILVLQKPSPAEKFAPWRENAKIKSYAAWGKSPFAALLGKCTGVVMGSPAGRFASKIRRKVQRMTAPTA